MFPHTLRSLAPLGLVVLLLGAGTARAVDGVIEINDASIIASGGYPFLILAPGSYVLTSNLSPPPGTSAIVVPVAGVEIDLNGFSVTGSGGAFAFGIDGTGLPGLTVKNGTIEAFSGAGILAGPEFRLFKTRVIGNGGGGVLGAFVCLIVENTIIFNGGLGIDAFECKIENNVVNFNDESGIAGDYNVIVHNVINANGFGPVPGGGVMSAAGSTIQENQITFNAEFGISDSILPFVVPAPPGVPFPALPAGIGGNVIMKNSIDFTSPGIGIFILDTAIITDNTVNNSDLDGIVCGIACTLRGNRVSTNNTLALGNGGVTLGPGSTFNDNSVSYNTGIGLLIDPTAGWTGSTLMANSVQDMSVVTPAAPLLAHPTSGFLNLCSGLLGPAPGFCP